jgi:hypothetical protein
MVYITHLGGILSWIVAGFADRQEQQTVGSGR